MKLERRLMLLQNQVLLPEMQQSQRMSDRFYNLLDYWNKSEKGKVSFEIDGDKHEIDYTLIPKSFLRYFDERENFGGYVADMIFISSEVVEKNPLWLPYIALKLYLDPYDQMLGAFPDLESTTKDISYTKLANKMVSSGYKISKSTVIDYISYFEDAYLFFQNVKYEYSLTKQLGSIKKIYCIDNGMLNAVSFKFSEDKGKLLENLIFIELKRRGKETYYYRKNFECDFIIKQKNEVISAFQVTWELNEGNKEREISGLLEAMEKFKLKEGLILTCDTEDEKTINGKKIIIAPAWRWLLE